MNKPTPSSPWRHATLRLTLLAGLLFQTACEEPTGAQQTSRGQRIQFVEITPAKLHHARFTVQRTGTLEAERTVQVFNQEEGRISQVRVREGDRVKSGDLLIQLDDALLQAELAKARATAQQARQDLNRLNRLVKRKLAAEDELNRAQTALKVAQAEVSLLQTRLSYTRIKAPLNGVITQRLVEPGDVAAKHTHLLTLIDPKSLVTRVKVSELLLSHIKPGDPVEVIIDAISNEALPGKVTRIFPTVDARTRLGTVEVALAQIPTGARAGQLCRLILRTRERQQIQVPFNAVRRDQQGEYVFRVGEDNKAQRVSVETGLRHEGRIEILQGLNENDTVITRGFIGLKNGNPVKPVVEQKVQNRTTNTAPP